MAHLGGSVSGLLIRLQPRCQLGYSHMKTLLGLKYPLPSSLMQLLPRGFSSSPCNHLHSVV